ncbi:MAG: M48 family metallopeptidase [Thiocapsa sp.]|nr:M48 family metallopeptidase [Thiocapsa sp.]MCG6984868.1 M48 family metallopeptidase [Thiocapsa sp.]
MNFFEHQDRARRRTRLLVLLFVLAVISIILVVDLVALVYLRLRSDPTAPLLTQASLGAHLPVLVWVSALTAGFIGLASLFRILTLRGGGGAVARGLGGVLVGANTTDPQLQRLRNVVEEMAIAAGVPVPEIYVLEQEEGINAFAAGYSPADAAVAVTGGALRTLSRSELQGVAAHEFSHILNGDMRLNIRLIGILFGILVLALIGRLMLSVRHARTSRSAGALVAIALALIATGYIGLFFGRLIRASVSRQRELLADASAVQFTREPAGIAGALKKIAASKSGSVLASDTEEIGHMLFAAGLSRQLLATHPPLLERIRAIEPDFDPAELEAIRARLVPLPRVAAAVIASPSGPRRRSGGIMSEADQVITRIGRPDTDQIRAAAELAQAIPQPLARAARSTEWVVEAICYLLMDPDAEIRERQLLMVAEALGIEGERQVSTLLAAVPSLAPELRIPLLEIGFPTLRRRPQAELNRLMDLIDRLIRADGRVDVFEYALARLLSQQIRDAIAPTQARGAGTGRLTDGEREARDLLMILARQANPERRAAQAAFAAGLAVLGIGVGELEPLASADWSDRLDRALARLDDLRIEDKQRLLRALIATVRYAGVSQTEVELLRAVVAALHVPMPLFT